MLFLVGLTRDCVQGALIAFSSLSALYNVVEIRPLFLRERSNSYYRWIPILSIPHTQVNSACTS